METGLLLVKEGEEKGVFTGRQKRKIKRVILKKELVRNDLDVKEGQRNKSEAGDQRCDVQCF